MDFTLENPLTGSHPSLGALDDDASAILLVESSHMPSLDYVESLRLGGPEASVRRETVLSILQLSRGLGPSSSYLAINYLDRFLSGHQLSHALKPWILRLLAVSCVSLASKMLKTENPFVTLQGDYGGLIIEASTIQRMEAAILSALKWRMRSVTPFSFVSFFISGLKLPDPSSIQTVRDRAIEILLKAQHDVCLLEFKPSATAASALLVATLELFPSRYPGFETDTLSCSYVNKQELSACIRAMQDVAKEGYESGLEDGADSSAGTPTNVLDHHFACSDSETTNDGETESGIPKRRKTH